MTTKRATNTDLLSEIRILSTKQSQLLSIIENQSEQMTVLLKEMITIRKIVANKKKKAKKPKKMGRYNAFVKYAYNRAKEIDIEEGNEGKGVLSVVARLWKQHKEDSEESINNDGDLTDELENIEILLKEIIDNAYIEETRKYNLINNIPNEGIFTVEEVDAQNDVDEVIEPTEQTRKTGETSFNNGQSRNRRRRGRSVKVNPRRT